MATDTQEPVTIPCPFCKTPITKDSEACCISMIVVRALCDLEKKRKLLESN